MENTDVKLVAYVYPGAFDYNQIGFALNYDKEDYVFVEADSYSDGWLRAVATGLIPNTEYSVNAILIADNQEVSNSNKDYFTTGGTSEIEDVELEEFNPDAESVVRTVAGMVVSSGGTWVETKSQFAPGI